MEILNQDPGTLFTITGVDIPMPPNARIDPSVPCDCCKEPTMASKLVVVGGQSLCRDCLPAGFTLTKVLKSH